MGASPAMNWPTLRRQLGRLPFARSSYVLLVVLKDILLDTPRRNRAWYNREFEGHADPWDAAVAQQPRYRRALAMIDSASAGHRVGQALEIGCAEGVFTEMLATRCESLLAMDFAEVALQRAKVRCGSRANVRFELHDFRCDRLADAFDLVTAMCVLETFKRPGAVRTARAKLVSAVRPGGYLLVENSRQSETFETAWWARPLLRGGKRINAFVAEDTQLEVVAQEFSERSVTTLLRRVQ